MNDGLIDTNMSHDSALGITPEIKSYLKETAKWAKLISIVNFVALGIMVLMGLFMGTIMGKLTGDMPPEMASPGLGLIGGVFSTIFFLAFAALLFFPALYLYRFATKMKTALAADDQVFLSESFKNLKSFYKFTGILVAIGIALYALGLVLALFGGVFAMM